MPQKRKKIKLQSFNLSDIKNHLRGNSNRLRPVFSEIRQQTDPSHYRELASEIYNHPFYQQKLFGTPFAKTVGEIKRVQPLQSAGLVKELLWATALVEQHATTIARCVEDKNIISDELLKGSYQRAFEKLSSFEERYGQSLFLISTKIYLLHHLYGIERQKEFVREAQMSPGINGLVYYIIYYMAFRLEEGGSLNQIRKALPSQGTLRAYLTYRLTPFDYLKGAIADQDLESIVRNETNSSLVDLYETLFRVLQFILHAPNLGSFRTVATDCIRRLGIIYTDRKAPLMAAILNFSDIAPSPEPSTYLINALDEAILQDMPLTNNLILDTLTANNPDWRSTQNLEQNFIGQISKSLSALTTPGASSGEAVETLEKSCSGLSGFDFSWTAFSIVSRLQRGANSASIFGNLLSTLNCGALVPDTAEFISDAETRNQYLTTLESIFGTRPSIIFSRATLMNLPPNAAVPWHEQSRVEDWLTLLRSPHYTPPSPFKEEIEWISRFKDSVLEVPVLDKYIRNLIEQSRLDRAAELTVYLFLQNQNRWPQLPFRELISAIEKGKTQKSNIAVPILWDLWVKHFDPLTSFSRAYATEDTWESYGVNRPSQLPIPAEWPQRDFFIYFLRHVCIPSILDESDAFQRASEIDHERITLCQILSTLDPTNGEDYKKEIRAITKRLVIKDGLRLIEQSKIHVDVEELQVQLTDLVRVDYERLVALSRDKILVEDISEMVKRDVKLYRDDEITQQLIINFRQDNPETLLATLAVRIWREFATNSHYGLDVYLSTRIRHGTLIGHLRTPMEEQGLMLQRDAVSGIYKDNPYWTQRLGTYYETEAAALQSALKDFSAEIDEDLIRLNGEQIRTRTESEGPGWFWFYPSDGEFILLKRALKMEPTLTEFIAFCLRILGRRLEAVLKLVRTNLNVDLRGRWSEKLAALRLRIEGLELDSHQADVDAAILRAQAAVDQAIDRVVSWFTLSTSANNPDYAIDLALDIAAESVRNCFGRDSVKVILEEPPKDLPILRGRTLVSLVDVFFILIENAVRHARPDLGPCIVRVSIQTEKSLVLLQVSNDLPSRISTSSIELAIASTKSSLSDATMDRTAREGGTGFHKLRKIMSMDLGSEHSFDFEISDGAFVVTIMFDAQKMAV